MSDLNARKRRVSCSRPDEVHFYDVFKFLCALGGPNGKIQKGRDLNEVVTPSSDTLSGVGHDSYDSEHSVAEDDFEAAAKQAKPTLGEVLLHHPRIMRFCDVRRLMQFATIHGFEKTSRNFSLDRILHLSSS